MAFEPSPEADAQRFGVRVERKEYPPGLAGVKLSLTEIAKRIREGGRSPAMRQFAEMIVRQSGIDPSRHLSQRDAAQILLDYVRANVRYRPDQAGVEYTQGAAITLCVPGAQMCIPVGDCDDLLVAMGSLMMAYGLHVRILKQAFAGADMEHVLVEFQDESGNWIPADPSVENVPVGWKATATEEHTLDPLDMSQLGLVGAHEVEFIGVGAPPRVLVQTDDGRWREYAYGQWWLYCDDHWVTMGAPASVLQPGYQLVTDGTIRAGLRYRIQFVVATSDLRYSDVASNEEWFKAIFGNAFFVESVAPDGGVTGGEQSWTMQGIAKTVGSTSTISGSDYMNAAVTNVAVQASGAPAPANPITPPQPKPTPPSSVSAGTVGLIAVGTAVVAGVGWKAWEEYKRRRAA